MTSSIAAAESTEPRDRILAVAVRLFAQKGFEGTSIRDITSAAGCGVAAVNYYFNGKDSLYEEAFRSLLAEVQGRRMTAIQSRMAADPEMDLEGFLRSFCDAFLEPLVEEGRGRLFMAFFARELTDQHLHPEVFVEEFIRPFLSVAMEGLSRVGPPMDRFDRMHCLMSVVGQLIHLLRVMQMEERHPVAGFPIGDRDDFLRHIVRFSAAGIRAYAVDSETEAAATSEEPTK